MTKRIQRVFLALVALAALAVGGSAFASAKQSGPSPAPAREPAAAAEPVGGPDTDNIQSGDQTTPDTAGAGIKAAAAHGKAAAAEAEPPGTEQSPAGEHQGETEQPGAETAPDSDGPGGHADEPGNASADHQFEGQE